MQNACDLLHLTLWVLRHLKVTLKVWPFVGLDTMIFLIWILNPRNSRPNFSFLKSKFLYDHFFFTRFAMLFDLSYNLEYRDCSKNKLDPGWNSKNEHKNFIPRSILSVMRNQLVQSLQYLPIYTRFIRVMFLCLWDCRLGYNPA